ncbi:STAS domain-containing protein [Asanoa sp. NPDC049573]|uniref:STAS domain-containing protein n=1 Tax=Asanoa sp. NPDC049573 TaxID=3155396 RepID=UPI00341D8AE4
MATVTGASGNALLSVSLCGQDAGDQCASPEPLLVTAAGEVDIDTAPLLRAALVDAVSRHSAVHCDLREVTFFSAAGAAALADAHRRARQRGCQFVVRGARGVTELVLRVTGIEQHP